MNNPFDTFISNSNSNINSLNYEIYNQCNYYNSNSSIFNITNVDTFSLIHFNARSLVKNMNNISDYLQCIKFKFDIIIISETWLNKFNENLYNINNYNVAHTTRTNKRGGGVSIYVNSKFKFNKINSLCNSVINKFDMVSIEIIQTNCRTTIISGLYKCPEYDISYFSDDLFNPVVNNCDIYLCGDYNINILNNKSCKVKHFIDTLNSLDLRPIITKPSRTTNESSTLIDNIFTNNKDLPISNGLMITDISDHYPNFVIYRNLKLIKTKDKKITNI